MSRSKQINPVRSHLARKYAFITEDNLVGLCIRFHRVLLPFIVQLVGRHSLFVVEENLSLFFSHWCDVREVVALVTGFVSWSNVVVS